MRPMDPLKNDLFRALCLKVADETDPKKLELLKQRMRILLQDSAESEGVTANISPKIN
jgi:hypothetical protein